MNTLTTVATSSAYAFDLLTEIEATASKNEKLRLVGDAIATSVVFRTLICQALDPFTTFGMKKVPKHTTDGTSEIKTAHYDVLGKLARRELTGNAAINAVSEVLSDLEPKSRELFIRVLTKNLKAGFSAETVNKSFPDMIYTFKVQLSEKLSEHADWVDEQISVDNPWFAELKEDGVRGIAHQIRNPAGNFFSREGKPLNASDELLDEVVEFFRLASEQLGVPVVLDGEISSIKGIFNDVVGDVHKKSVGDTVMLKLIDLIPCADFENKVCHTPYTKRREFLESFMELNGHLFPRIKLIKRWEVTSVAQAFELAEKLISEGEEGIILKNPNGFWQSKRTKDWLKVKDINTVDLVVKRLEPGEKGKQFEHIMGAAICDLVTPQGTTIEVSIGGGWSVGQREDYWVNPELIVGQLIEIEYHELTKDGSLRHPRFKRIRTGDKPIEDGQGC